jgi:hypothetical protein
MMMLLLVDDEFVLVYYKKLVELIMVVDILWLYLKIRIQSIDQNNFVRNLRGESLLNKYDCSRSYGLEVASGRNDVLVRYLTRLLVFECSNKKNVGSCCV